MIRESPVNLFFKGKPVRILWLSSISLWTSAAVRKEKERLTAACDSYASEDITREREENKRR